MSRKKADSLQSYKAYFELAISLLSYHFVANYSELDSKIKEYDILPENTYGTDKGFFVGLIMTL